MAVNLVGQAGLDKAAALLESSFAQFQADRAVVGIARQARRSRAALAELGPACELGDYAGYHALRQELSAREARRVPGTLGGPLDAGPAVAGTAPPRGHHPGPGRAPARPRGRPGPRPDRPGRAGAPPGANDPLPLVLTAGRQVKRLSLADFPVPVTAIDRLRIPNSFSARSPQHRRDLASTMRNKVAGRDLGRPAAPARRGRPERPGADEITRLRRQLRQHPCHGCPDREVHARQAEQRARLEREVAGLEGNVAARSHVIARTFDRVCSVLNHLGYLDDGQVTPDGRRLADLYTELDLLAAECLRRGLWDGLDPAELAACVSVLTFESRQSDDDAAPRLPRRPGPRRGGLDDLGVVGAG